MDANHHLLNTWLIEIAVKILGPAEFVIRLPNVLSFLLFAFFAIKIALKFESSLFRWGVLLILLLNPFVNDYFCLARGYGISMALLLASLYYALEFTANIKKYYYAFCCLLYASLGLLANFSLLNYLLVLLVLYCILIASLGMKSKLNYQAFLVLFIPLVTLSFTIPIVFKLKDAEALFVGKNNGFWQDTVISLIQRFIYARVDKPWLIMAIEIGIAIFIILSILLISIQYKYPKTEDKSASQTFLFIVLIGCILANILQNYCLGVLYGIGRTAMYYYPLFSLYLIFSLKQLKAYKPYLAKSVLIVVMIVFVSNFAVNANTQYAFEWQEEGDSKLVVKDLIIQQNNKYNKAEEITVGMGFPYHDDFIFYKDLYALPWLNYVQYEYTFNVLNDYFFIPEKDTVNLKNIKHKIIARYKASASVLIENLQKWTTKTLFSEEINFKTDNPSHDEVLMNNTGCLKVDSTNAFSKGFTIAVADSFLKNPIKMMLSLGFNGNRIDNQAKLVFSIERNGQAYLWTSWALNEYLKYPDKWNNIHISTLVPPDLQAGDIIKCYVWNTSIQAVYLRDLTCNLVTFQKIPLQYLPNVISLTFGKIPVCC